MLSFHVKLVQTDRRMDGWMDRQTDRWTDRWTYGLTKVKQYAPDLSMRGNKKVSLPTLPTLTYLKHLGLKPEKQIFFFERPFCIVSLNFE